MKKILIASACALTLCLTSCATKQAPESESQTQAPQNELQEETETETSQESQDSQEQKEDSNQEDETDSDMDFVDLNISSEDFPEPEFIDEPEIITLEPQDYSDYTEEDEESEEVENEEPPVIAEEEPQTQESEDSELDLESESEDVIAEAETQDEDETDIDYGPSDSDDDGITAIGVGIDITDEDSNEEESYNENQKEISPSRSVTLKKFEYLDVKYPGTGWIYMGLTDNSKDLAYFGRKLGTKDTKFSLQARAAGTKIIHFYRNDPLTGQYLDDYVEVIILAENGSNKTHVAAPEYKLPVQKKEKPAKKLEETSEEITDEKAEESAAVPETQPAKQTAPAAKPAATKSAAAATPASSATPAPSVVLTPSAEKTPAVTSTPDEPVSAAPAVEANPNSLLQEAQVLYNEKEYKAALSKLNQFFEYSTDNRDQALYLKGQILEAKSDVRDIKGSIDAYTTLTKNYPASKLWDSANKRIIYLKRFYLEVR